MRTVVLLAAAAAVCVAATAEAGDLRVGRNGGVAGAWSASPQAATWPVDLSGGQGYALAFSASWCARVSLLDRGGRVVAAQEFGAYDEGKDGFEALAPRTGRYSVRIAGWRCDASLPARGRYVLSIVHDCLGSARTVCRLRPGEARRGFGAFTDDEDWYGADLLAGHAYDVVASGAAPVAVLDAAGDTMAQAEQEPPDCTDVPCRWAVRGFSPPASGRYFVAVLPRQGSFSVSLSDVSALRAGRR